MLYEHIWELTIVVSLIALIFWEPKRLCVNDHGNLPSDRGRRLRPCYTARSPGSR